MACSCTPSLLTLVCRFRTTAALNETSSGPVFRYVLAFCGEVYTKDGGPPVLAFDVLHVNICGSADAILPLARQHRCNATNANPRSVDVVGVDVFILSRI